MESEKQLLLYLRNYQERHLGRNLSLILVGMFPSHRQSDSLLHNNQRNILVRYLYNYPNFETYLLDCMCQGGKQFDWMRQIRQHSAQFQHRSNMLSDY